MSGRISTPVPTNIIVDNNNNTENKPASFDSVVFFAIKYTSEAIPKINTKNNILKMIIQNGISAKKVRKNDYIPTEKVRNRVYPTKTVIAIKDRLCSI